MTREPEGSPGRVLYDEGVRFACWGMSMYSLSCSCYSFLLDKMVARFRAKPVYIGGQLVYSAGMVCLALTRTKWAVLVFSWTAGVMYSTLFTMPYLLVTALYCIVLYCTVLCCRWHTTTRRTPSTARTRGSCARSASCWPPSGRRGQTWTRQR